MALTLFQNFPHIPSIKDIVVNPSTSAIYFFIMAQLPLIAFFSTTYMNTRYNNLFHSKYFGLMIFFLILILCFSLLIFDTFSRIRTHSSGFVDFNSFVFNSKFFIGVVALIVFVTFIAIRKRKYTKFEHIFIMIYSLLSLYFSSFILSKFEINYKTLFVILVIFLINVGILTLSIKFYKILHTEYKLLYSLGNIFPRCSRLANDFLKNQIQISQFNYRFNSFDFANLDSRIQSEILHSLDILHNFNSSFEFSFIHCYYMTGSDILIQTQKFVDSKFKSEEILIRLNAYSHSFSQVFSTLNNELESLESSYRDNFNLLEERENIHRLVKSAFVDPDELNEILKIIKQLYNTCPFPALDSSSVQNLKPFVESLHSALRHSNWNFPKIQKFHYSLKEISNELQSIAKSNRSITFLEHDLRAKLLYFKKEVSDWLVPTPLPKSK